MKKMHRMLCICLVCCLMLAVLPVQAFAAEEIVTEVIDRIDTNAVGAEDALPQLGTPTNLYWSNGYMHWTMTDPHQFNAETCLYKVGQSEPIRVFGHSWMNSPEHSFNALQDYIPENGASYYFTVRAISGNDSYRNSSIATSPTWTFVQPAERLGACTDVSFDGMVLTWTPPAGTDSNTTYAYRFLYASDKVLEDAYVEHLNFRWGTYQGRADVKQDNLWAYNNMAKGYYFTEVRAESKDITTLYHGPWMISNLVYFNGSSFEIVEAPHAHVYVDSAVKPTCTEQGYTLHTCDCGHSYADKFILPTGLHIFANDQDTTCETCGYVRELRGIRPVVHMFRMYDPNSGEHFYTGSEVERQNLIDAGWNYEGVGFTFPLTTGDPVYRLYDPVTGEHLYTMDEAEKSRLMSQGWNYEGIAFNSGFEDEVPQYRLHNPNETRGAYHFTASLEERENLLAVGWEYQGIGWYSCWK